MAIKAFSLFGEIELKGDRVVVSNLKKVSHQVDITKKDLGSLKGNFGFGGGALSGLNSALGTLSNISNVIQGIPVVGSLINAGMSALAGPVKDLAQLGLGFNDLKENATLAFSVILKDGEKAKKLFAELEKFGVDSPIFKNSDMIRYAQQLLPITGAGPELFDALKGVGAMTAVTGDLSRMGDIFLAMTQIARKPKLSSEEMNQQLSEAGVDAWGLLARGLGRTPGEIQAMSSDGRLSGIGSFKVMVQQALREYGSLVDSMGQTRSGKQAQIDDLTEQKAARGTQNLHGAWKEGQDRILAGLKGPQGDALADQINDVTGTVAKAAFQGLDSLLDGSFLNKIQKVGEDVKAGITKGFDGVKTGAGNALEYVLGFKSGIGSNSPATEFIPLGQYAAQGFLIGFEAEMIAAGAPMSLFQSKGLRGLTKTQSQNYEKLEKVNEEQPEFLKKLIAGSKARGINPDHLLNVLAFESGFNARADNPNSSAYGLIQFMASTRKSLGVTQSQLSKMSESEQLDWVFKYFDQPHLQGKLDSQAALYAAVAAGRVGQSDQSVLFRRGSDGYNANKVWDANKDGLIQQGELGRVALSALGAGDKFTLAGAPISQTNPMPVTIAGIKGPDAIGSQPGGGNFGTDAAIRKMMQDEKDAVEAGIAARKAVDMGNEIVSAAMAKQGKSKEEIDKFTQSTLKASTAQNQTVPGIEKLGEAASLTAEQIEANRKLAEMEGPAKKKKRDRLFDAALTREGIAGDFHSGLQSALMDPFSKKGWGNAGMGLLRDIQGRAAHDVSSMITGALFGTRGEDGGLTGGLFSSLFGGFLGSNKKGGSWADFKLPGIGAGADIGGGRGIGGLFSKIFGSIFGGFRASGGGMSPGRFYMAGEHGPELVAGPGYVYNASQTQRMMQGGGGREQRFIFVDSEREAQRYRSTRSENFIMEFRRNRHIISRFNT